MNVTRDDRCSGLRRGRLPLRWVLLGGFVAAAILQGCDTLVEGDETLILQPKNVTFRFEFSSDDLTPGTPIVVQAVQGADLGSALQADGYTKNDVVAARVTAVQLRRVNPLSFNLGALDGVVLRIQSQGLSSVGIGSLPNPPSTNNASMNLGPTRNVEQYVRQASFNGSLEFVPTALPADDYVLEAVVEITIEVEGV